MRIQLVRVAALIAATVVINACGGGGGAAATTSMPQVSINLASSDIRVGDTTTLSWLAQGATSCTASGAWSGNEGASGSLSITASQAGTSTYSLSCSDAAGDASGSVVLTVAPPLIMTEVPGLPAPVPLATGQCAPETNSEYTVTCISAASAVPSEYALFSGTSASLVTQMGGNTPTVQNGTNCNGGFDSSAGEFEVTTSSLGSDAIAISGATISEVTYSASYIASINQGLQSLTALVIADPSNLDHFEIIVVSVTTSGNLMLAVGGTIATNASPSNISVLECLNITSTPPPPPPPQGLSCASLSGSPTNGLGWAAGPAANGDLSYNLSTTAADQQDTVTVGWGVAFDNPQLSSSAYSGSVRVELWALPYSYQSPFQGYRIAMAYPNFTGTGAKSSNQLYNGYSVTGISSTVTGQNPPSGSYCMVLVLAQYDPTCSGDHYCVYDWTQFSPDQSF